MLPASDWFARRISLVTGLGSGSGKTTFTKAALASLHRAGERCIIISAGFEGGTDPVNGVSRVPVFQVEGGDVFLTAARLLPLLDCAPVIMDVPSRTQTLADESQQARPPRGMSALGPLVMVRAGREGVALLAGPSRNDDLPRIIQRARELSGISTVLVDGSLDRISQISALPEATLFCSVMADKAGWQRAVHRMTVFHALVTLPVWQQQAAAMEAAVELPGLLTSELYGSIAANRVAVVVDDMAHVFLSDQEVLALASQRRLHVRRKVTFGGFCVVLRDVDGIRFRQALRPDVDAAVCCWNPYVHETPGVAA
ncbi:MAG: hypothetical protein WHT81_08085 [Rectinemataceae bacterium]